MLHGYGVNAQRRRAGDQRAKSEIDVLLHPMSQILALITVQVDSTCTGVMLSDLSAVV